jgi:hypothetical protein
MNKNLETTSVRVLRPLLIALPISQTADNISEKNDSYLLATNVVKNEKTESKWCELPIGGTTMEVVKNSWLMLNY